MYYILYIKFSILCYNSCGLELMCVHFYFLQYNDTNRTYNRTPAGYVIMIHFILKQFLCPLNRTNLANSLCSCDQNT